MFAKPKPRKKVTFCNPVITEVSPRPKHPPSSENTNDAESTRAEAEPDLELDRLAYAVAQIKGKGKKEMSTSDESSDAAPEWTREEDRIICVMKSEAKSWAEIGGVLERSRRECQLRHRALSSRAKELGITTAMLAKLYIDEDNAKSKSKSKSKKSSKDKGKSEESNEEKSDKSQSKSKGKSKKGATKPDSKSEAKSKSKSKKEKNKKDVSPSSDSGSSSSSDDKEDEAEEEEEEEEGEEDPVAEYWAQRRYLYDTVYGEMYPDQKVLRPDRFYSESDCRILANLEARYRANKWLQIQADFCNATGRMVEGEMLKAKFYED